MFYNLCTKTHLTFKKLTKIIYHRQAGFTASTIIVARLNTKTTVSALSLVETLCHPTVQ